MTPTATNVMRSPAAPTPSPEAAHARVLGARASLLLLAAFWLAVLAANFARVALEDGLGAHEDEAGHVITSLFVRDWLAAPGFPPPLAFAEQYYLRYPKLGIGQWPPLFHTVAGVWTLIFGASQFAFIALSSLLSAATAWLLALLAWRRLGPGPALLAATLFLALPLQQWYGAGVMLETPLALGCLASAWMFGRWLERPSARTALAFGLLAAATSLVKGNGLCLVLVPPIALLLRGRLHLFGQRSLWLMPLPVLVLCLPWFMATVSISRHTWAGGSSPSLGYFLAAGPFYLRGLVALGGAAMAAAAVLGIARVLHGAREDGTRVALVALVPAVLLMHMILPSSLDERHLLLLAAPFTFLAVEGAVAIARAVGARFLAARVALWTALAAVLLAPQAQLVERGYGGHREALEPLFADSELADASLLVSSDSIGDGMFITAAALCEERGRRVVLRATKSLGRSGWLGSGYVARFQTAEALEEWLAAVPVTVLAIDNSLRPHQHFLHHDQLLALVEREPTRWRLVATHDVHRAGKLHPGALRFYRSNAKPRAPAEPLDAHLLLGQPLRGR